MADLTDSLRADLEAHRAIAAAETFGGQIENDEREGSLEVLLAGIAVAKAVLALGVRLDFVSGEARRA